MDDELRSALAEATTASAALSAAMRLGKAKNAKLTLGFVARRAGIPSTGYLSDVMSGRRRLSHKYREGLFAAVGVEGTGADLLRVLCALEDEPDEEERSKLEREREALRKFLRQQSRSMPERLAGMFFAFEVFGALGLSGQRASRAQLRAFFGAGRGVEIERALAILLQAGLVERRGEDFHAVTDQINFFGGEDGMSHLDYLTMALRDAEKRVSDWYGKKDESFFSSSIISVKDSTYRAALPSIKDGIRRMESEIESGEADRIVRVSVQIYPLEG